MVVFDLDNTRRCCFETVLLISRNCFFNLLKLLQQVICPMLKKSIFNGGTAGCMEFISILYLVMAKLSLTEVS